MNQNNKESLLEKIRKYKKNSWTLGNEVLYRLCREHPLHKLDDEIGAKIWLIGRAYSVSIERRKIKTSINDDYYNDRVIPKIKKSNIDKWIKDCKIEKTKDSSLRAHKKVTDLFKDISGLEKRSLASKYLHFHLPDLFFIYDSRAVHGISVLLKELNLKNKGKKIDNSLYDKGYSSFFNKCLKAKGEIIKQFKLNLKCRELDTLLINIANEHLRK
ncbi:conserved hypothetical protein [Candidatus Roizmanbacteria bacterium]|nr:conserved hypothetical protein [Candidatus Roizmanbacteria bacterium]